MNDKDIYAIITIVIAIISTWLGTYYIVKPITDYIKKEKAYLLKAKEQLFTFYSMANKKKKEEN